MHVLNAFGAYVHQRYPAIRLNWGGEDRSFALSPSALHNIEVKTGCGCFRLFERMRSGDVRLGDVEVIIAESLECSAVAGRQSLLDKFVRGRPIAENLPTAQAILGSALFGFEDKGAGNG